jgi:hypothetical protein
MMRLRVLQHFQAVYLSITTGIISRLLRLVPHTQAAAFRQSELQQTARVMAAQFRRPLQRHIICVHRFWAESNCGVG